jgi:hypothetical protein
MADDRDIPVGSSLPDELAAGLSPNDRSLRDRPAVNPIVRLGFWFAAQR